MSSSRAVGIDLGTAYTTVARVDEMGRSLMVRNPQGDLLTPSVVYFEDEEVIFGRPAKLAAATQPGRAAEFVMRDLGQLHYSRAIDGELLPTELIEACLLNKLCADLSAEETAKPAVVLAMPAALRQAQRRALLDAAQIAGVEVLGTINGPLAAGLAFAESHGYLNRGEEKPGCRVLVFDLGGGKLDVAIVEVKPGRVRAMAIGNDAHLGGRDWDMRLADHLADLFAKQFGEDPRYDMITVRRMLERAEETKQTLTSRPQTRVRVDRGANGADITVTRQTFDELTADLVERARRVAEKVLSDSGLSWRDLAHVLLIGGATRMPCIVKMFEKLGGLQPAPHVHADEAIARGAALHAAQLLAVREGRAPKTAIQLTELTSHSLGVEWIDPISHKPENVIIITRGTELPCAATSMTLTTTDDQRTVTVQMLEGETRRAEDCTSVANIVLGDLPSGLPRQAPIEVHYQYTVEGRLQVKAHLVNSEQPVPVSVQRSRGMTESELADWRQLLTQEDSLDSILALAARHQAVRAEQQATQLPSEPEGDEEEQFGTDLDEESAIRGPKKSKITSRKIAIMAVGHVLFATLGLAIGYYILMRVDPSYNWWHLRLPGLSPAPASAPPR